jgi:hypothetical protein
MNRKKLTAIIGGVGAAALVATAGSAFTAGVTGLSNADQVAYGQTGVTDATVTDMAWVYVSPNSIGSVTYTVSDDTSQWNSHIAMMDINGELADGNCVVTQNFAAGFSDTIKCSPAPTGVLWDGTVSGVTSHALILQAN